MKSPEAINGNGRLADQTSCICDHAGYCPLMRATMFPEEFERCRTDESFHRAELKRRGIRRNGHASAKPAKSAKPCGEPCEETQRMMQRMLKQLKPAEMKPHVSTKPVVCNNRERAAMGLRDQWHGQRVFLIGGGPSLRQVDLTRLQKPGITIAAMNNVATMIRPHIWFAVDKPRNFHETIWRDPAVMKFTMDKHIHHNNGVECWSEANQRWEFSGIRIQDCPNVWGFDHRAGWDAALFFDDSVPTWGSNQPHQDPEGSPRKSVMLPSLWMLYWLGFRVIYLLGCDFKVGDGQYAFDQKCEATNDDLFGWLDRRLNELAPYARAKGLSIFNLTENSGLTAFLKMDLDAAIAACSDGWPDNVVTRGQYRPP